MSELIGKIVIVTGMRRIPTSCTQCTLYDNMGGTRGPNNEGACTARGKIYSTQRIASSKQRLKNCPLRLLTMED